MKKTGSETTSSRSSSCEAAKELIEVVDHLMRPVSRGGCPWTASIQPREMIRYLKEEIGEAEEEMADAKSTESEETQDTTPTPLEAELGDILFDVLMLIGSCARDHPKKVRSVSHCWRAAAEKVKRRTPYMKEWWDGSSVATTKEEALTCWMLAKRKEKNEGKPISGDANERKDNGTMSTPANAFSVMMRSAARSSGARRREDSVIEDESSKENDRSDDAVAIIRAGNVSDRRTRFVVDGRPRTEEARERCRNLQRHIQAFFGRRSGTDDGSTANTTGTGPND